MMPPSIVPASMTEVVTPARGLNGGDMPGGAAAGDNDINGFVDGFHGVCSILDMAIARTARRM